MKKMTISQLLVPLAIAFTALMPNAKAAAGTKVPVGANVPSGQQVSMDRIDHQPWDALLKRYVDQGGNVNYAGWKRSAADQQTLDAYAHSDPDYRQRLDPELILKNLP